MKASYMLSRGEVISVSKNGFNMTYKVVDLLDKRVSAKLAQPCYENLTPDSEMEKYKKWFVGDASGFEQRLKGDGRPTKKDRRKMDRFKKG